MKTSLKIEPVTFMFTINELSPGADHMASFILKQKHNNYCRLNKDKIHHLCTDLHFCKVQACQNMSQHPSWATAYKMLIEHTCLDLSHGWLRI